MEIESDDNSPWVDRTVKDLKEYASLRADSARLSLIENLSRLLNTLFAVTVLIVLAGIAAVFFAVALTWLLGSLIGSVFYAVLIIGALFAAASIVVYRKRDELIINRVVQMLAQMAHDMTRKHIGDGKN